MRGELFLQMAWLIPVLPFVLFAVIGLGLQRLPKIAAAVSIGGIAANFLLSAGVALTTFAGGPAAQYERSVTWLDITGLHIDLSILIDPLTAAMLLVVTTVALLVQIYSLGYMHDDPGFARYYAYQTLFVGAMLGLVVANNFGQLFIFWELVGICSFLLIGFWYGRNSAKLAARKAFITNRVGDVGLLLGIVILQYNFGTLNYNELTEKLLSYQGTAFLIPLVALLLFIGPMGKSAQFPLHVWLPDAMEGPTPVSALIHAATMVAAGVYLLSRCVLIFHASPAAMLTIAIVGGFTALFAASIALVQNDIKRILAFSTLSQLGYMVMAVGMGAMTAAMFHLVTHAFFKSLLFLGAGSVIHAMHDEQDIWKMGNLSKKMPITTVTFIIGSLALAGIPPLAGFWSKDEILLGAFAGGYPVFYAIGSLVAFMTAFYMFRLIFTAFYGANEEGLHAHESPCTMTAPLIILATLSVFVGFLGSPFTGNVFGHYITYPGAHHHEPSLMIMAVSTVIAVLGIGLAWLIYQRRLFSPDEVKERLPRLYETLYHKFYIDEFYGLLIRIFIDGGARVIYWIDLHIINGLVNLLARTADLLGERLRLFQDGQVQTSALVMMIGMGVVVVTSVLAVFYAAIM